MSTLKRLLMDGLAIRSVRIRGALGGGVIQKSCLGACVRHLVLLSGCPEGEINFDEAQCMLLASSKGGSKSELYVRAGPGL